MSTQAIIWTTIAVYAVFMLITGILNSKSSSTISSFTVGGRNAGAWISALSYGTAYFSAVMFIGYAGNTGWSFGLWAVACGIGNAVFGSWLAWKVLAKRTRDVSSRLKLKTMPDFFQARYQSPSMKFFSAAVIYIFLLPYSASVYKGLTSVCSVLLGIDDTLCMIIIAIAAAVILTLGGYLAALKADFVQGIVMMFGIAFLIFFVFKSPAVQNGGGLSGMWNFMKQNQMVPLSSKNTIALLSTVLMTSFGTWGLPQMIHKYYGIRDDKEVKRGTYISTFFALLVAGGGYLIGSMSHLFFNEIPQGGKDFIVPNMLKQANLPAILLGIVLVLLISASVSTLTSITLSASSTLSLDLINPKLKKPLSDKSMATLTKVLCILFVVASYFIANSDTPILDMMSYSWGIISGSFLAPYMLALYWKKITKSAAWTSIISGFVIAFIPAGSMLINLVCPTDITVSLAAMGPQFAVVAMVVSMLLCVVVTLITAKDKDYNKTFYEGVVEAE
ncbi:MAG: sodium:solute symporter family protein [Clostridia bacterium]|nr:sodium:solute symporter family protein [Clostridia bacterium]